MVSKASDGCRVVIEGRTKTAEKVFEQILSQLHAERFSKEDVFAVHLGLEEAFLNAVKHGNKEDPAKKVTVDFSVKPAKVKIVVSDEGKGFNPSSVPDPTAGDNIYKVGGRGLFLIRSYMDKMEFNKKGNCICMTKFNSARRTDKHKEQ
jgi:serine/threonine-protein kinase RsbW